MLDIIRIPGRKEGEDRLAWQQAVADRLGLPEFDSPADAALDVTALEFAFVGGALYKRRESDKDYMTNVFLYRHWGQSKEWSYIEIVCPCGQTQFTLRYYGHAIFARCPDCGREESVYDG